MNKDSAVEDRLFGSGHLTVTPGYRFLRGSVGVAPSLGCWLSTGSYLRKTRVFIAFGVVLR
jgi:hypothetical protein